MIYNYQYLEDEWTKGYWKLISNKLDHENECVWFNISGNDNITRNIIANNLDKPWDWQSI